MEFPNQKRDHKERQDDLEDIHNQKLNIPYNIAHSVYHNRASSILHEPRELESTRFDSSTSKRQTPNKLIDSYLQSAGLLPKAERAGNTGLRREGNTSSVPNNHRVHIQPHKREGNLISIPTKSSKVPDVTKNNFVSELSLLSRMPNRSTSGLRANKNIPPVSEPKKFKSIERFPAFSKTPSNSGVQIKGIGTKNNFPEQRTVTDYVDLVSEPKPEPPKRYRMLEDSLGKVKPNTTPTQRMRPKFMSTPKSVMKTAITVEKVDEVNSKTTPTQRMKSKYMSTPKQVVKAATTVEEVEVKPKTIFSGEIESAKCFSIDYTSSNQSIRSMQLEIKECKSSNSTCYVLEFNIVSKKSIADYGGKFSDYNTKGKFDNKMLSQATLTFSVESCAITLTKAHEDFGGLFQATLVEKEKLDLFVCLMREHFAQLVIEPEVQEVPSGQSSPALVTEEVCMDSKLSVLTQERCSPTADEIQSSPALVTEEDATTPSPLCPNSPTREVKKQRTDEPSNLSELFKTASPEGSRYPLRSKKPIPVDSPEKPRRIIQKPKQTPLLFNYFTESGGTVGVHEGDKRRLHPKEFLNDVIIEFYLNYTLKTIGKKAPLQILSTFLYPQLLKYRSNPDEGFKRLDPWVKSSFFKQEFILVPIIESFHWYLVIIGRPNSLVAHNQKPKSNHQRRSALLKPPVEPLTKQAHPIIVDLEESSSPPSEPWIAILNSMETGAESVSDVFRDYVAHLAQRELEIDPKWLKVWLFAKTYHPPVPQQRNGFDCGIFLLEFAETFMSDPYFYESLIVNSPPFPSRAAKSDVKAPREREMKWIPMDPVCKRNQICELIDSLATPISQNYQRH
ncbi:hypothetical protein DSO57_1025918 [Entomophthora muscae]|uniref:Uncharacterized protein n=1 Tax=Entomophthora muscae TaxID=34485 RepID=A0ACC2S3Y2_9FUNG|nr:hypothetical protein DSO57_1025918 [Entomophthora muscae]